MFFHKVLTTLFASFGFATGASLPDGPVTSAASARLPLSVRLKRPLSNLPESMGGIGRIQASTNTASHRARRRSAPYQLARMHESPLCNRESSLGEEGGPSARQTLSISWQAGLSPKATVVAVPASAENCWRLCGEIDHRASGIASSRKLPLKPGSPPQVSSSSSSGRTTSAPSIATAK